MCFQQFQEKKLKQELKVKLEMAKFLQDTIEDTALQSKKPKATERAKQFAHFIEKVIDRLTFHGHL